MKIINSNLQLNIDNSKRFFFGLMVLLFVIMFSIIFIGAEDAEDVQMTLFDTIKLFKEKGFLNFSFSGEGDFIDVIISSGNLSLGNNYFENLLPNQEGVFKNSIKMDKEGNVVQAYLRTEDAGNFIVNGNNFDVPENGVFRIEKGEYLLPEGTKINDFVGDYSISGKSLTLFDEITFSGLCSVDDEGYLIKKKGNNLIEGNYKGFDFTSSDKNGLLIVKDESLDLKNSKSGWIKKTDDGNLFVKGKEGIMRITMKEGNGFFEMLSDDKSYEEKYLSMTLKGEDSFSLSKEFVERDNFVENSEFLKLTHVPSGKGSLDVYNGQHHFTFDEEGEFFQEFSGAKDHSRLPVEMEIHSGLGFQVGEGLDSPKYKVTIDEKGDALFEDFSVLGKTKSILYELVDTVFGCGTTSEIGEEMCKCASKLVNVGAFVEGGRGKSCSIPTNGEYEIMESPVEGVLMFDCIGVAIYCLNKVYPETSLFDFSPDLRLSEDLEKRGWKSYMIEPGNLIGIDTTQNQISKIPKGSVAFTLNAKSDAISMPIPGVSSMDYRNSMGESYSLIIGHTYVKANGFSTFVNANPSRKLTADNKIYETLLEYNKEHPEYDDHYGEGFYKGPVKYGELTLKRGHLLVISPP